MEDRNSSTITDDLLQYYPDVKGIDRKVLYRYVFNTRKKWKEQQRNDSGYYDSRAHQLNAPEDTGIGERPQHNQQGEYLGMNEFFGLGGNKTESPKQGEIINKIKEMTQQMVEADPNDVVFAGGSPEAQIQMLTKAATDNKFRGQVIFKQSPRDGRTYLMYIPEKSGFAKAISPMAGGTSVMGAFEEGTEPQGNEFPLIKGFGYWDVSKYPYGGDFKRFNGNETGQLIKGTVKKGDEVRIKLSDGREIVTLARAVAGMEFDDILKAADAIGRVIV